jgi:hypothetical protein
MLRSQIEEIYKKQNIILKLNKRYQWLCSQLGIYWQSGKSFDEILKKNQLRTMPILYRFKNNNLNTFNKVKLSQFTDYKQKNYSKLTTI